MSKKLRIINKKGNYVELDSFGASISDLYLGKQLIYTGKAPYNGATIGRTANRTLEGRFTLEGKSYQLTKNEGDNHLHGGHKGFDKQDWDMQVGEDKVVFYRESPDGEEGYPGNLKVWVEYSFNDQDQLLITYKAKTDKATPVSLTNHIYIRRDKEDLFQINSPAYTTLEGEEINVEGTDYDLRIARKLPIVYDHNYIVGRADEMKRVASAYLTSANVKLDLYTTYPGMQFYTGVEGTFCFEPQAYPNAVNIKTFPSLILNPDQDYKQEIRFDFSSID